MNILFLQPLSLRRTVIEELIKAPPIGEARDRELLKNAHSFIYFNSPHGDLVAHFFVPHDHDPENDRRPIVIHFHGGLWDSSMPTQMAPHCLHFAMRGAVTVTVEYRVSNKQAGVTPLDALEDAAMIQLFIRTNAHLLGVDPDKMILAGAGSGAHLALCCTTLPKISTEPGEQFRPAALFLLSPVVNVTPKGICADRFPTPKAAKAHSPSEHAKQKGLPPCIIFHARQDRVVPFEQVAKFAKLYAKKKNRCELIDFQSGGHTFFNYNSHQQNFAITLRAADAFLVEAGLLEPDPFPGEL
ncbi:MAG: alpha/beta hydrolase [Akkermansiaceae bacterium]|nr:alpha/beta hydrolase [Akkermansiaceae bacterium]